MPEKTAGIAPRRTVPWEIGGAFQTLAFPKSRVTAFPRTARWYSLGRHALAALIEHVGRDARLWLPDYFCEEVTEYCRDRIAIVRYRHDPISIVPDWATLQPNPTDLVIAVNYFGLCDGSLWKRWRRRQECIFIEDHSHDPASVWARNSTAHYAFASMRKTLPVADGALLWSPSHLRLPQAPSAAASHVVNEKTAAMDDKAGYLAGSLGPEIKSRYRALFTESEDEFCRTPIAAISQTSARLLQRGIPTTWRKLRRENFRALRAAVHSLKSAKTAPVSRSKDLVPLGLPLLCDTEKVRDHFRAFLEAHNIYCAVHWPVAPTTTARAAAIARRMLTIPTDQRYTVADMKKIAEVLLHFV